MQPFKFYINRTRNLIVPQVLREIEAIQISSHVFFSSGFIFRDILIDSPQLSQAKQHPPILSTCQWTLKEPRRAIQCHEHMPHGLRFFVIRGVSPTEKKADVAHKASDIQPPENYWFRVLKPHKARGSREESYKLVYYNEFLDGNQGAATPNSEIYSNMLMKRLVVLKIKGSKVSLLDVVVLRG